MAVRQIRWFPYIAPSVVERLQATLSMPLNDRGISDYQKSSSTNQISRPCKLQFLTYDIEAYTI